MKYRRIFVLLLLAPIALWQVRLLFFSSEKSQSSPGLAFEIEQVELLVTNAQGKPEFRLQAENVQKPPGHQQPMFLQRPVIRLGTSGNTPANSWQWHLQAQNGVLSSRPEKLTLMGEVHAQHLATSPSLRILTDHITYTPSDKEIRSTARVRMIQGPLNVQGQSLRVDLQRAIVHIQENIQGHYDAP